MLVKTDISETYHCMSKIISCTYFFIVKLGFIPPSIVIYSDTSLILLLMLFVPPYWFFTTHLSHSVSSTCNIFYLLRSYAWEENLVTALAF